MNNIFIRIFMRLNVLILRVSHGKLGNKLGTQTILILRTIGRKSGKLRDIPIAYFTYEDKFLIVASNWGKNNQAIWFNNLKKDPNAILEITGKQIPVIAREAVGEEYSTLWQFVTDKHPPYKEYQLMTQRKIPIMIFEKK